MKMKTIISNKALTSKTQKLKDVFNKCDFFSFPTSPLPSTQAVRVRANAINLNNIIFKNIYSLNFLIQKFKLLPFLQRGGWEGFAVSG